MHKNSVYKKPVFWGFYLPPVLWFAVFMMLPLGILWSFSFGQTNAQFKIDLIWTLDNYISSFQPIYLDLFFDSVILSSLSTVICLVIGFFVALFISFASPKLKTIYLILIILPFWINILIRVFGISSLLSNTGIFNKVLEFLWDQLQSFENWIGLTWFFENSYTPLDLLYNYGAVLFGMVYVSLPFMVLTIYSSLDRLDISYIEASMDLGASQMQTIFKVILPMIKTGISFGIFLTFIPSLSTFLVPEMLGGPNNQMIANVIQRQFTSGANWPLGSAFSFMLMYITFILFMIHYFITMNKDFDE